MTRFNLAQTRRRRLALEALETRETPASLSGHVFVDFNNDSLQNFGETGIGNVTVTLNGKDSMGNSVSRQAVTSSQGDYTFDSLPESDANGYTILEQQPAAYRDGREAIGNIGGVFVGSATVNDTFSKVTVLNNQTGDDYNFGERPQNTTPVSQGQSAPITFWADANKGQALIQSLNGGPNATQLGNWLAATMPNVYASCAGLTNTQIAAKFLTAYNLTTATAPPGPADTDAQVMATALGCYVTNVTLAGNTAIAYGFQVTTYGLGARTISVGLDNAAFQISPNTLLSVMDVLVTVNRQSFNDLIYDNDHSGAIQFPEDSYRRQVKSVCARINAFGPIISPVRSAPGGRI